LSLPGKNISILVCDTCDRWFHLNCSGVSGVNGRSGYTAFTCEECSERSPRSARDRSRETVETETRQTNSCVKRNIVASELSETRLSSVVDQMIPLDRIESVNSSQSNQGTDDVDDDVIVLD